MLYERWRMVARERGSETALRDSGTGRSWTFSQLLTIGDNSAAPGEAWVFPRGTQPEFIFTVLQAWRHGRIVCPLELTDPVPATPPLPRGIVHVKRTSATTGPARQVMFTAEQISADPANICRTMGLRPDWPNVGAISLAYSYGFSNLVLPLLLHGIPLLLIHSPLPEMLRNALTGEPAVTLPGVPALWRAWFQAGVLSPNIRLAISAGAPLPIQLEREVFEQTEIKIHNFLGASECGGIAYDRTSAPRNDSAVVGSPFDGVDLSAPDGVLEVRGAAVAEGYWPASQDGPRNGVFRSNDLVEIREGLVCMRGRAADVMNIAGRKVPPEEIERALLAHPSVIECVVFDAPRAGGERQIVAVIAGPKIGLESIRKHLAAQVPAWQMPRQWFQVESLEVNERGKISRARWRERFIAGQI